MKNWGQRKKEMKNMKKRKKRVPPRDFFTPETAQTKIVFLRKVVRTREVIEAPKIRF